MQVILVHGIFNFFPLFGKLAADLQAAGHQVLQPDLQPADARYGLAPLAEQLRDYITQHCAADEAIAIIAFSMGGLVARHYLQHLGGAARTQGFITIATPHHGTLNAHAFYGQGARDMRPNSAFLRALQASESALDGIACKHSYRTPFDVMIVPSKSSNWCAAHNHVLPVLAHRLMPLDARLRRDVRAHIQALHSAVEA